MGYTMKRQVGNKMIGCKSFAALSGLSYLKQQGEMKHNSAKVAADDLNDVESNCNVNWNCKNVQFQMQGYNSYNDDVYGLSEEDTVEDVYEETKEMWSDEEEESWGWFVDPGNVSYDGDVDVNCVKKTNVVRSVSLSRRFLSK